MQGEEEKYLDLQRRYALLKQIRARYRAFIIDEYQDTNPDMPVFSPVFGVVEKDFEGTSSTIWPWDPTICIVGDMKQSIYRFRQAEVTVMRRMVASIRVANSIEQNEPRLEPFIQSGMAEILGRLALVVSRVVHSSIGLFPRRTISAMGIRFLRN